MLRRSSIPHDAPFGEDAADGPRRRLGGPSPRRLHWPHVERHDWFRHNAVELGRRTGGEGVHEEVVLPETSPWHQAIERLGELRRSLARRDQERAIVKQRRIVGAAVRSQTHAAARAERALRRADVAEQARDRAAERRRAAIEARRRLPRLRRGHRTDELEIGAAAASFLGTDVVILGLSQRLLVGTRFEHYAAALSISLGLLVYAHGAGWLLDLALPKLPASAARRWIGLGLALIAIIPLPAFWLLQEFRSEGLEALARADHVVFVDPKFFAAVQVVLMIAAIVASYRWFAGAEGRELLDEADDLADEIEELEALRVKHERRGERVLRRGDATLEAADVATEVIRSLQDFGAADGEVEREHAAFVNGLHDAEYLVALEHFRRVGAPRVRRRRPVVRLGGVAGALVLLAATALVVLGVVGGLPVVGALALGAVAAVTVALVLAERTEELSQ